MTPEERIRSLDASFLPLGEFRRLADLCLRAALDACGPAVCGAMVHGSALPAELGGKGGAPGHGAGRARGPPPAAGAQRQRPASGGGPPIPAPPIRFAARHQLDATSGGRSPRKR